MKEQIKEVRMAIKLYMMGEMFQFIVQIVLIFLMRKGVDHSVSQETKVWKFGKSKKIPKLPSKL